MIDTQNASAALTSARHDQHSVIRVALVIARAVHRNGPAGMGRKAARKAVASRDRAPYADSGLALAVTMGWVAQTTRQLPQRPLDPVPWYVPGETVPTMTWQPSVTPTTTAPDTDTPQLLAVLDRIADALEVLAGARIADNRNHPWEAS